MSVDPTMFVDPTMPLDPETAGRRAARGAPTARAPSPGCPAELTLDLLAGRWKPLIVYWLLQGERRFNALQRDLRPITHRTLARQLREMEADGLVARRDHGENPPRVDYRLTPLGRSLESVLVAMHDWALTHGALTHGAQAPRARLRRGRSD